MLFPYLYIGISVAYVFASRKYMLFGNKNVCVILWVKRVLKLIGQNAVFAILFQISKSIINFNMKPVNARRKLFIMCVFSIPHCLINRPQSVIFIQNAYSLSLTIVDRDIHHLSPLFKIEVNYQ